ncbi:sugar-phosphatase [Alkalibacterium kapii]|uniref:Sugar phosphate phosphatase n=1 Tax=Alkalibacterium kapii TaxID=426704 RepID=A0A511AXQ6_9LACT|nr:sugar-phosphatase [Alkalibacterium kapii]GEK92103.1 sugar phosphate phosphatase [Alkalibacterium kapii]
MTIKLIAIDIDGTLLNTDRKVTKEVKEAIHAAKQADIRVVLCTGRPFPGVVSLIEELELNETDDYVISYNGALVQNTHTEEKIIDYTLTHDDYLFLEKTAREAGSHFHAIHNEGVFTPNKDISKYTVREAFIIGLPLFYRTPGEMDPSSSYNKMMMIDEPPVLEAAIARLPESLWENYTLLRSEPYYFEILNKKASKGKAVKALAEHLNIDRKQVMAIGDSGNDIDLVDFAGIGVAMENATDEVKAVADVITASNNNHGVAHAINTYALDR